MAVTGENLSQVSHVQRPRFLVENYHLFGNDTFFTPVGEHSPLKEPVKGGHRGRGDKRDSIGVAQVRGTPEVQPQPSGLEMMTGKSTFVS